MVKVKKILNEWYMFLEDFNCPKCNEWSGGYWINIDKAVATINKRNKGVII